MITGNGTFLGSTVTEDKVVGANNLELGLFLGSSGSAIRLLESTFNGNGRLVFVDGTFNVGNDLNLATATVNQDNGTITGAGTVTISSNFTFTRGEWGGFWHDGC